MTTGEATAAFERWLGDVRPAWAMLPPEIAQALLVPDPLGEGGPLRIRRDLPFEALAGSAILRNARLVMAALERDGGAKLTAKGNLGRAFVAAMVEAFDWPDHDRAAAYRFNTVLNETDFMPLYFLHRLLRETGLARRFKGRLVIAKKGRAHLALDQAAALQAELITILFTSINLGFLDRWPDERFPHNQIGLVLFLLGQAARQWRTPRTLVRSAALPDGIPIDALAGPLGSGFDPAASMFEQRVLRYLHLFGLMERRLAPGSDPGDRLAEREYRLTPLFERSLAVTLPGIPHDGPLN